MSNAKRKEPEGTGRGPVGKTAVVGDKDCDSNQVAVKVFRSADAPTLQVFVKKHADPRPTGCTDDSTAYESLTFDHDTVKHTLGKYFKGDVLTNGIESLWSMLKRANRGTFHKFSSNHLDPYVQEFAGRHNVRNLDTIEQMQSLHGAMDRKRLTYKGLAKSSGLASGASA